jgi:glutamyl-tRNA synthetase
MEITHVFRGEEHITNTPKQIMVYQAFGWEVPTFGHMTIIVNEKRKKLSKRDKDVVQFIGEYDQLGYLPEAMLNFLSLLGWTPASDKEILSREELISLFDEHKLSAAPSYFDRAKLAFINSRYIKQLTMDQLKALCRPFLEKAHIEIKSEEWLEQLLGLLRDRLSYGAQIVEYYHAFFHEELTFSEEVINELNQFEQKELVIQEFLNAIENIDFNDSSVIEQTIKEVGQKTLIKGKALFMPIRIATTGEAHGPSLPISLSLLGKDKVIARIKQTLKMIKGVS